ncbi:hypothetical protein HMPREF9946_02592 [Acetobacteraceae bacterium AT-5844]|nr:hypothetical protein HMPREF9946_02592 [Acetobacteraceae bacterium AT-5844]
MMLCSVRQSCGSKPDQGAISGNSARALAGLAPVRYSSQLRTHISGRCGKPRPFGLIGREQIEVPVYVRYQHLQAPPRFVASFALKSKLCSAQETSFQQRLPLLHGLSCLTRQILKLQQKAFGLRLPLLRGVICLARGWYGWLRPRRSSYQAGTCGTQDPHSLISMGTVCTPMVKLAVRHSKLAAGSRRNSRAAG